MAQRNQTTRRPRGMFSNLLRNVPRTGGQMRSMVGNLVRRGMNQVQRGRARVAQNRPRNGARRVDRNIHRGRRQDFGHRRRS